MTSGPSAGPDAGSPGESVGAPAVAREEWAHRFRQQGGACAELGSDLYGRLLPLVADDIEAGGRTWDVLSQHRDLRFGQAAPLRLLGAAHRLALHGTATDWAALMPSCGGTPPESDAVLAEAWNALTREFGQELEAGLGREVQTNEVGRASALGLAQAMAAMPPCRVVEFGTSAGLNLRLGHFSIDLGGVQLGDRTSEVKLAPEIRSGNPEIRSGNGAGFDPSIRLPETTELVGVDPHPLDVGTDDGAIDLLGFFWPDQVERIARTRAAIGIAQRVPARLIQADDTASVMGELLADRVPTVIQHSITWQYVPTRQRWQITDAIEAAGRSATAESPVAWIRYEPDEWHRGRAALRLRRWPVGTDTLVGHVDYHGRWLEPVQTYIA